MTFFSSHRCRLFFPALLSALFFFPLLISETWAEESPTFAPFVEQFAQGRIDWDNGKIYGVGRAYLDANMNSPIKARKAAELMASAHIIRLASGIRLDDKQTLAALGQQKTTLKLEAFIRDERVKNILVDDGKRPYYEATRVASLKGISGLTARLISALRELEIEWIPLDIDSSAEPLADDDEPWLVLDARNLPVTNKLQPALFPKIISEDGEVIYELRQVETRALNSRGMGRYVISDQKISEHTPAGTKPFSLLSALDQFFSPQEAVAGDKKTRKKRRSYIVKEVKQAAGLTQTTLMISAQDAKKVKKRKPLLQNP